MLSCSDDPLDSWLKERGLDRSDLEFWGCSVYHGAIAIPVYSLRGRWLFDVKRHFQGFRYEKAASSRVGMALYGVHKTWKAIAAQQYVAVVEGHSDLMALYKSGVQPVVSVMGSRVSRTQAAYLAALASTVLIWFDGDEAGVAGIEQALTRLRKHSVNVVGLSVDGIDPAGLVAIDRTVPGRIVSNTLAMSDQFDRFRYSTDGKLIEAVER